MTTTRYGTLPLEAVDRALGIRGYLRGPWRVLDETYANGSELIRVIPPVGGFRLAATGVTLEDDGPLRFGRADVYVLDDADWLEEDRIAPTVTEAAKIFDEDDR